MADVLVVGMWTVRTERNLVDLCAGWLRFAGNVPVDGLLRYVRGAVPSGQLRKVSQSMADLAHRGMTCDG